MSLNIRPLEIAAWHRQEADRHEKTAKSHLDMALAIEAGHQAIASDKPQQKPKELKEILPMVIQAVQLEEAVHQKSGRISDLALRLRTDEKSIELLLEPHSKVYVAARGWLKVRE